MNTILVTGKLTYNGAPLADAIVTFVNDDPDLHSASGKSGADGTFKLDTIVAAGQTKPGAVAGDYTVTVTKTEKSAIPTFDSQAMKGLSPEEMAEKMQASGGTPKKLAEGAIPKASEQQGNAGSPMATEAPKSYVPSKYASPKTSDLKATVSPTSHEFNLDLKD